MIAAKSVAVDAREVVAVDRPEAEAAICLEAAKVGADVDFLTIGQYLQPTPKHHAVDRFVTPEEFAEYRRIGLEMGFLEVVSGPLVRSSYRADQVFEKNNCGL